jgi:tetratricopeptide (TPR) repeat protein
VESPRTAAPATTPAPPPAAAAEDWKAVQEQAFAAMWRDLDRAAATAAFERLAELAPQEASTFHFLSMLRADERAWPSAIAAAERYVELAPEDAARWDALGEVFLMAGRMDEAQQAFRSALERAPGFAPAIEGLAYTYFYRDDWAAGLDVLERGSVDAVDPGARARLAHTLAWALVIHGRVDEGEAQLLALAGDDAFRRELVRTQVALERGRWSQAIDAGGRALDLVPAGDTEVTRRWITLLRAAAAARMGDLPRAEELIAQLEQHRDELPPHITKDLTFARGNLALAQGDTEVAVAAFTDRWVLNHTSLYDPGRGNPGPGFGQFALAGRLFAAEALAAAGRRDEARVILESLRETRRRGIGAVAVWLEARAALADLG